MTFVIGDETYEAPKGTFLRIPARTMHDFMNKTVEHVGAFNLYIPGGFEDKMPDIVQWFKDQEQ